MHGVQVAVAAVGAGRSARGGGAGRLLGRDRRSETSAVRGERAFLMLRFPQLSGWRFIPSLSGSGGPLLRLLLNGGMMPLRPPRAEGLRLRSSNRNLGLWMDVFRLRTERDGGHASEGERPSKQQPSHSPIPKKEWVAKGPQLSSGELALACTRC